MTIQQLKKLSDVTTDLETALISAGVIETKLSDEQRLDMVDFLMPVFMENLEFFEDLESENTK